MEDCKIWNVIKKSLSSKSLNIPQISMTVGKYIWCPVSCGMSYTKVFDNKIQIYLLLTFVGVNYEIKKTSSLCDIKYYKGGQDGFLYEGNDLNISIKELSNYMYSDKIIDKVVDFYRKNFEEYLKKL